MPPKPSGDDRWHADHHWRDASIQNAVSDALEAERRQIARQIEASLVSQINLLLAQLHAYQMSADARSHLAFSVLVNLVQQLLQQVYDLQTSLHPTALETLGLAAALETFASQQRRLTGVNITLALERHRDRLPADIELALFRAVQDVVALATARGATTIMITWTQAENRLDFTLSANGVPAAAESFAALEARFSALGGTLTIGESRYGGIEMAITLALRPPVELTEREIDVIRRVAAGETNRQIALALGIRPRTVKFHLDNIYSKLGVNTRTEAAVYALRQGWVTR